MKLQYANLLKRAKWLNDSGSGRRNLAEGMKQISDRGCPLSETMPAKEGLD
jgi:hypothetical protein